MKRIALVSVCLFLICIDSIAQQKKKGSFQKSNNSTVAIIQKDMYSKIYSSHDGVELFDNAIKDVQGYSWFVRHGVLRFDGKTFLKNDTILQDYYKLVEDKNGFLWLGSGKGIYQFKNGKPVFMFGKKNGLSSDSIISLTFDKQNNLWILTADQLVVAKYNSGKYELVKIPQEFSFNFMLETQKKTDWNERNKISKAFVTSDSLGNVWWGYYKSTDSSSFFCYTKNYFEEKSEIVKFDYKGNYFDVNIIQGGLLLLNNQEEYLFFDSTGKIYPLNKNLKGYLGDDEQGRSYFFSTEEKGLANIYRDKPKKIYDFGKTNTVFIYPKKVSPNLNSNFINDEVWLTNWLDNSLNAILKNNQVHKLEEVYPNLDTKLIYGVFKLNQKEFWIVRSRSNSATQVIISDNTTISDLGPFTNGIDMFGYNYSDSSIYVLNQSNNESINSCLYSFKGGIFSPISKYKITNKDSRNAIFTTNCGLWKYIGSQKKIIHLNPNKDEEAYSVNLKAYSPDNLGGCFVWSDTSQITYLKNNKIKVYPIKTASKYKSIIAGYNEKVYLLTKNKKIETWLPFTQNLPTEIKALATFSIDSVRAIKQSQLIYFRTGSQEGWIDDGKVFFIDTTEIHRIGTVNTIAKDESGRIIITYVSKNDLILEIIIYERGKFKTYPLKNPANIIFFRVANSNTKTDEIIYIDKAIIYRYDNNLNDFYFLKDVGQHMGYIWDALVQDDKLFISGWSSKLLTIDLNKSAAFLPLLHFTSVENNRVSLEVKKNYTINFGDKFLANYYAIDKFNQNKIIYQTRIILEGSNKNKSTNSIWLEPTKNESKEIFNLQPGNYRFEVRVKGASDVWGQPIGFDFKVLPPWYRTWWAYLTYIFAFILLLFSFIKIRTAKFVKDNQLLEKTVSDRTKEVVKQKELVEQKNHEITSSIEYALRIQTAILPPSKIVKQTLEDSFILYKPKDIVAGDFYWMETLNSPLESGQGCVLFAACDCTGHGVPGALVSVVCHNALNRAVREFGLIKPAEILDKTNEIVKENFSESEDEINDGMDISLCAYYPETKILQWAGANNPLWLIKNNEFIETRADKQPIGKSYENKPFTNHEFILNAGDTVYVFSDGFADQFGGEIERKLTKKSFKELLLSIQNQPMQQQGASLDKFITDYRNEIEQTDDILVMGVKI